MTSKHCFFNMLREDFRHKLWMLALSVLGNLLAMPVLFLISVGNDAQYMTDDAWRVFGQIQALPEFFQIGVSISGGIVALSGALITGFFGFRFVFHRNMADTYHSLPVRRKTLFLVNWLNGFLIWFVPFLISVCVALALGIGRLGTLKGRLEGAALTAEQRQSLPMLPTGSELALQALVSVLALTVAFLLVYHLVLLAVMLCGNLLNAMVTAAVLGVGALIVYGLALSFCILYFDTFVSAVAQGHRIVVYASPCASAVNLLYQRVDAFDSGETAVFWISCVKNLLLTLGLLALSFIACLKRPSELAEQGLRLKPVRFLMLVTVSLAAAMSGWLVFWLIGGELLGWAVFGAVLTGVLAFGVMDIIFSMEFKAFFAHRVLMGLTAAAGVFIGLLFHYDWIGFDRYLPAEEKIAEISVYSSRHGTGLYEHYYGGDVLDENHPLNRMHFTDADLAYAFLKSAVDSVDAVSAAGTKVVDPDDERLYVQDNILVKVTLKNGGTYYRSYRMSHENSEQAGPLFTDAEYLNANFRIGQEEIPKYSALILEWGGARWELSGDEKKNSLLLVALCEAYNRDLEENPRAFIYGDGRLLCGIRMRTSGYSEGRELEVYEGMVHTREVLREYGYDWMADPIAAEEIEEIRLGIGWRYSETGDSDLVGLARRQYGVWAQEEYDREYEEGSDQEAGAAVYETQQYGNDDAGEEILLRITDRAEIAELLELLDYDSGRYSGGDIFRPGRAGDIYIIFSETGANGEEAAVYASINLGALPEKYVLRFGTLQP